MKGRIATATRKKKKAESNVCLRKTLSSPSRYELGGKERERERLLLAKLISSKESTGASAADV